jgi:hypothetical protein
MVNLSYFKGLIFKTQVLIFLGSIIKESIIGFMALIKCHDDIFFWLLGFVTLLKSR